MPETGVGKLTMSFEGWWLMRIGQLKLGKLEVLKESAPPILYRVYVSSGVK